MKQISGVSGLTVAFSSVALSYYCMLWLSVSSGRHAMHVVFNATPTEHIHACISAFGARLYTYAAFMSMYCVCMCTVSEYVWMSDCGAEVAVAIMTAMMRPLVLVYNYWTKNNSRLL